VVDPQSSFLENLFVGGMVRARSVPQESGVRFYVHETIQDEGICLIFSLDWGGPRPLIGGEGVIKPDYLVLFVPCGKRWAALAAEGHDAIWYCTLVELKGAERKNLKHGLDQLQAGYACLRSEFAALPGKIKIRWQGVLLCPENADIPREDIVKISKAGFPIVPVQNQHAADLYPYVRGPLPREVPRSSGAYQRREPFRLLEKILMADARRITTAQRSRGGLHLELGHAEGPVVLRLGENIAKLAPSTHSIWRILRRELAWMRGRLPATTPHGYRASSCGSFKIQSSEEEQQEGSDGR
jgi:hypothetical protein